MVDFSSVTWISMQICSITLVCNQSSNLAFVLTDSYTLKLSIITCSVTSLPLGEVAVEGTRGEVVWLLLILMVPTH